MSDYTDKMVWVDLETTGLDEDLEVPLELGLVVTDTELNILANWNSLIRHPQWQSKMSDSVEWVRKTHQESGLLDDIRELPEYGRTERLAVHSWQPYDVALLACHWLSDQGIPEGVPMCGSSPHFDRRFLKKYMRVLDGRFGYRHLDVSALSEACKFFNPTLYARTAEIPEFDKKNAVHRVLPDLYYSITKLRFLKDNFLIVEGDVPMVQAYQDMIPGAEQWLREGA